MKKEVNIKSKLEEIFIRYTILIIIALPNLFIFYRFFSPLTVYPSYFFINLFYGARLIGDTILVREFAIEIVDACVSGSAYYLLTILNLSTPNIKLNKRVKLLIYSYLTFLILNVLRIIFLSFLLIEGSSYFDVTHSVLWISVSTLFVVIIWFLGVKYLNAIDIPIYSDVRFIYEKSLLKNKK